MKSKILGTILLMAYLPLAAVQAPKDFLNKKPGDDGILIRYDAIQEYFEYVAEKSDRVKIVNLGQTTLGNDMIAAIISSAENLIAIDRIKEIARALSLGKVDKKKAATLAGEGKAIVALTCNLHSTEIGSSQMALELLHHLAVDDSPDTTFILDQTVCLLVPSVNPDGQIMVVDWYNKYRGTPYEGTSPPYLYHHYAGHDNNRDWFKLNLKESQHVTRFLYHEWFPQIVVDEHQMGSSGDRFFVPPFQDPPTPSVHPLVWRIVNVIGTNIAYDLEKMDYRGVASRGFFTGWWIGALDDTAWFHNMAGILFEAASVRVATPVYIEPEEVRSGESPMNTRRMFSPNPWDGGWWRLRDIMNYDYHASLSVLRTAARHRRELLAGAHKMARENISLGRISSPFAYAIITDQPDPLTAEKLVSILLKSNIEVYRLTESLELDATRLDAGTFIVPLSQPYRNFVSSIFSRQDYPDLRDNEKQEPKLPYDVAGWTLPLGMGVRTMALEQPFSARWEAVESDSVFVRPPLEETEGYYLFDVRHNSAFRAVFTLLREGIDVWRNEAWDGFPVGCFITPAERALPLLRTLQSRYPLDPRIISDPPLEKFKKLQPLRVALYQNWGHNMTEGWTRYVFDDFNVDYETVHARDVRKKAFSDRFDVLVFVGVGSRGIREGLPPKRWERWAAPLPPEYSGGIGKQGGRNLHEFLQKGKVLVFMGDSCEFAIDAFELPVSDVKENNKRIVCPGSYLQAKIKPSPLTLGLPEQIAVFYHEDPIFRTYLPRMADESRRTPVVFGTSNPLLSGWLDGHRFLLRKALVVDYRKEGGRIVLFGPDIIHRGHSEGTFKLMFNALLAGAD